MEVGALQLSLNLVMLLQPILLEILFSLVEVTIQQIFSKLLMCLMWQVTHGQYNFESRSFLSCSNISQ
jgi:hypothetical protein